MPPPSAYAGGYSDVVRRQLENVVIPERIKCATCKKIRMRTVFSKRQLDFLRNAIVTEGAKALSGRGHARCMHCVSGQAVELHCSVCNVTKPLSDFAKAQRGNNDSARCISCVQRHTETEPMVDENQLLIENEHPSGRDSHKYTSQSTDDRLTGDMLRLTQASTGTSTAAADDDDDDDDDMSIGGGVWVEQGHHDDTSTTKGKERMPTGVDAKAETSDSRRPSTYDANWGAMSGQPQLDTLSVNPRGALPKRESRFARVPAKFVNSDDNPHAPRAPQREIEMNPPSDPEDSDSDGVEGFL